MKDEFDAKSPAKLILIGDHAVVHGYLAVVGTIGLFVKVHLKINKDSKVRINIANFQFKSEYTWEEILAYSVKAKNIWQEYSEKADLKILQRFREDSDNLVKLSLIETLKFFKKEYSKGIDITIDSEVSVGGFGSSTAACSSIIKAFAEAIGVRYSKEDLFEIVMNVERHFYPNVSGLDQSAVVYGGILKYRKKNGKISRTDIPRSELLDDVLMINSGTPESTTGEAVTFVTQNLNADREKFTSIFEHMENQVFLFIDALEKNDKESFYKAIDEVHKDLVSIGVVTKNTQQLIKSLQALGGHLKISGGGSIKGLGSGSVLCFADDLSPIIFELDKRGIKYSRVSLGIKD